MAFPIFRLSFSISVHVCMSAPHFFSFFSSISIIIEWLTAMECIMYILYWIESKKYVHFGFGTIYLSIYLRIYDQWSVAWKRMYEKKKTVTLLERYVCFFFFFIKYIHTVWNRSTWNVTASRPFVHYFTGAMATLAKLISSEIQIHSFGCKNNSLFHIAQHKHTRYITHE